MFLLVNGKRREFAEPTTLERLVEQLGLGDDPRGVAVALNSTVVPRDRWALTRLNDGDTIEIIHAVQGG